MKLNGDGNLGWQKKKGGGHIQKDFDKEGQRWRKGNGRCTQKDFGRGDLEWQSGNGRCTLEDCGRGGLGDRMEMEGAL